MMTATSRETFRNLIERVSGVMTVWARDPRPMPPNGAAPPTGATFPPSIPTGQSAGLAPFASIVMRISQGRRQGFDEIRREFDEDNDRLISKINGIRIYGISFICEVTTGPESPLVYLELLRTRLERPSVTNQLNALNLSIARSYGGGGLFDMQIANSDASGKKAILEMRFNFGIVDEDTTDAGDYIAEAPIEEVPDP